ncbi:hypothetical protein K439DRAFT_1622589 [Ramaria rubella]|nr:hypothetical protein K439DRAFT_1622589 [Ramaria rubella]
MPWTKIKATSQCVTSIHTSFLQNGAIQARAYAKAELRIRRGSLMDYSSAIERATLQELGGGSVGSSASPAVDMGEVWVPVDSISEDVGDWITVDDEESQTVYGDLVDGMQEIHHHHFIQRPQDGQSHHDRVQLQNEAWTLLYLDLVDAHLQWVHLGPPNIHTSSHPIITVIDIFAPIHPSTGISVKALELLQVLTAQCPQMSLQAFVKSLCWLHRVAYRPILRNQLSTAFDAYLEICQLIDRRINMELQCDTPKWQLQNACAPCTYVLQNEPTLEFSMLVAMDGNKSLKRVERARCERNAHGVTVQCENIERENKRTIMSDMYLGQEAVNVFRHEVKHHKDPDTGMPRGQHNPHADESTKKQLAIFHETGVFLAACRHGNVLAMCDMVQSGELAKYGLAVTNELLDTFGPWLMFGYDIGCGFSKTVNNSPLLGPKLHQLHGRYCVDHSMVMHIVAYVSWTGICFTSGAVGLKILRRLIHRWFEAWNQEYTEFSKFILDNYTQALANIASLLHSLADSMKVLNIPSEQTFGMWHQAECDYLAGLKHEPPIDVLHIEYLETLVKLKTADNKWAQASSWWLGADLSDIQGPGAYQHAAASSWKLEAARARALETLLTLQKAVQDLETKLEIEAHQSGTGYKLHKHIGKALKARSEAIHTAMKNYKLAAAMLGPPWAALEVQTVLDYVYLAQFDLLWESRALLPDLPWSQAPEREVALAYFKCQRSCEEILHLNVEVCHLRTWMDDEEAWMLLHIQRLEQENSALAFQVR